ncbi:hypothetical protein SLS62_008893 [Diatrype stigma]|uniref:non-specific serine/threonine protein kinase n=1 Tax=Diatrype stigma TaxID=117547 RepID=A0AAN9UPL8_9PEZI
MAHLQVLGEGLTPSKQKAFEDARKMQSVVAAECSKTGTPIPAYRLTELIGKGSFGRVYRATDLKTQHLVAVKIIDVDESDTANPKLADTYSEFLKEIQALQRLGESGAQNINHVIEALPVGHAMWMVTEYCAGGSVATLMKPTAPGGLQEKWIIPILREVAVAIHWVHKQGIIHRDIKCANVLVTEVGGVQLCDFGVAGMMESKFDKRSTFIGTPHWMAPELFDQNSQYGTEVDIWAFGSMVYEIASGLPPNVKAGVGLPQLGDFLREHIPRLEGDQYSKQLKDLVAFCLVENPSQRPTIEQVQQHQYIHNTSSQFPTSTLANLVKAYKLWEDRGGNRRSLFGLGGAQAPADLDSTSLAADEWNFSTTLAFDEQLQDDADGMSDVEAVRDVYGSAVDFPNNNFSEDTAKPKGKTRRRPPPQALAAAKAPLEKVFDPNTISNYDENSRMYYSRAPMPMPPPPPPVVTASDLPLRDDSLHSTLRESLIDLDLSLDGGDLSNYMDLGTIKASGPPPAGGPRASMDNGWSFAGATESSQQQQYQYDDTPVADPTDTNHERPEIEWQWPTSIPPAKSSTPDMSQFGYNDDIGGGPPDPGSAGRPRLLHHPTEPIGLPSQGYEPQAPRTAVDGRMSVQSLIDLDMSMMPDPPSLPELTRPSTANSDVASMTGSESGGGGPFELERHASVYAPLPLTTREPSIYVSEDLDLASVVGKHAPQHQIHHIHHPSGGPGTDTDDDDDDNIRVSVPPDLDTLTAEAVDQQAQDIQRQRQQHYQNQYQQNEYPPAPYRYQHQFNNNNINQQPQQQQQQQYQQQQQQQQQQFGPSQQQYYLHQQAQQTAYQNYAQGQQPYPQPQQQQPYQQHPQQSQSLGHGPGQVSNDMATAEARAASMRTLSDGSHTYVNHNHHHHYHQHLNQTDSYGSGPVSISTTSSSSNNNNHNNNNNHHLNGGGGSSHSGLPLPPVAPPSAAVMEGRASPGEVTNEMRRLIGSLNEHLAFMGNQVAEMEPRRLPG